MVTIVAHELGNFAYCVNRITERAKELYKVRHVDDCSILSEGNPGAHPSMVAASRHRRATSESAQR